MAGGGGPGPTYDAAAEATAAGPGERDVVSAQLDRSARGDIAVVHRCVYGLPTVVRVAPQLADGTPFPTVFWLTCPLARRHVGRLEAEGEMAAMNERLAAEPRLEADYAAAARRYVGFRDRLGDPLPGAAGGMPDHVKCLHVALAHHLATGDNPVGAWTFERVSPMPCPGPCVPEDVLSEAYGARPAAADPDAWARRAPAAQRPARGGPG